MYVYRTASEIFNVKEWRDLETGVAGSFKVIENGVFDRSCATFYSSAIVSIALCYTTFELFDVE